MAAFLIVVGFICLVAGIVLYTKAPKTDETPSTQTISQKEVKEEGTTTKECTPNHSMSQEEVKEEATPQPATQPAETSVNENDESYEKGVAFEEYIVSRFSKKYFSLKEWRGDKSSNGVYAQSNTYPDMEYTFKLHGETYNFAVECKWRAKYNKENKVEWSYEEQLARYRQFAKDKNIPVFIVIGIGGTPSDPANVFVVPLASIKNVELSKSWLENYRHDLSKNMFFDIPTQSLR